MVFLSILASIIPTALYVAFIYWVDRYEKEPGWLLTACFIWGAVPSIILAVVFNEVFSLPFYAVGGNSLGDFASAAVVAPLVEESLKGGALLGIFFFRRRDLDSLLDGVIYGAMVGLGFAMVENFFYFMGEYESGGVSAWGVNVFLRAGVFGLNHALFSSMTGLGLAVAHLSQRQEVRFLAPVVGWTAAVGLHLIHNTTAAFMSGALWIVTLANAWGGVAITALIVVWALRQEKAWIQHYLKEEVAAGALTLQQYELAGSLNRRFAFLWSILVQDGFLPYRRAVSFFHLTSRLAYRKHHASRQPEGSSEAQIAVLRQEVGRLSQVLYSSYPSPT